MLSLDELKIIGAVSNRLTKVECAEFIPVSEAAEKEVGNGSVVAVNNPLWFATADGVPVSEAICVYSCDGKCVGRWDVIKHTYYSMVLIDSTLTTISTAKIKEKKSMADLISMEELDAALSEMESAMGESDLTAANAFDGNGGSTKSSKELSAEDIAKQQKIEAQNRQYDAIRKSFSKGAESMNVNPDVIRNNNLKGRLVAFVVPTDETIKIALRKRCKTDNQGKKILVPDAPKDVQDTFMNTGKAGLAYYVKETCIAITQAKPQKYKGIIVKTPEGTDMSLTAFGNEQGMVYDKTKETMKIHVLDNDTASVYLAYNYGDRIKEDEAVLGNQACMLTVDRTFKQDPKDPTNTKCVVTIRPDGRKSLIIPGNYFPLKVYDTISMQDPSEENKRLMELNVEALFAKEGNTPDMLCEEFRKQVSQESDGSYKFEPIEKGTMPTIETFYSKDATVTDIRLPKREKKLTKSGSFTYKNVFLPVSDMEAGPMSMPKYRNIVKATAMDDKSFVAEVSKLSRKSTSSSGSGKGVNAKVDYITFLRGAYSANRETGIDRKFADLQASIDGLI